MEEFIQGLNIIQRYAETNFWIQCENDEMYIHWINIHEITKKDEESLENFWFNIDSELECISSTRWGSC